ncbi:hypothetical protein K431DRAFT_284978 [Polychaeton citri CBS 116435]|uniref:Putative gamma-glutamylcyclotransferase n=1 Tax=Polychaeton citri CBS 116435 TaxID=1314669 RepID=A0A9P4Q6A3_9PEZI|nr:hypothetical protein K431DRAFT_284978 [Polychaeton citri CBS 116435]
MQFHNSLPPPAPPLPSPKDDRIIGKVSKFWLKTKDAPNGGIFFGDTSDTPGPDPNLPEIGPYFVYGTLMDPSMLRDVLNLDYEPLLRPARIEGYHRRSWGQYPALVDGKCGQEVSGMVYNVTTHAHARRLVEYESSNYRVAPVYIDYTDETEPQRVIDWTFKYDGRQNEL